MSRRRGGDERLDTDERGARGEANATIPFLLGERALALLALRAERRRPEQAAGPMTG